MTRKSVLPLETRFGFCIEADTRDNVIACRNVLAGLWAARLMQIPNHMVPDYASTVHQADFNEPGPGDVLDKLFGCLLYTSPSPRD